LNGSYYERVIRIANITNTQIIIRYIERPTEIFGQKLSKGWLNWHAGDITRIRLLIEFGGIYLDRDVYVVKNLDEFRKYELTLDFEKVKEAIGSQVIIANKRARFLKLWLESYRDYHSNEWYYNVGVYPAKVFKQRPDLVHRLNGEFGVEGYEICPRIYEQYYKNWRKEYYAFHLLLRDKELTTHTWCLSGKTHSVLRFDEINYIKLNTTFAEMLREVFEFEKQFLNINIISGKII